MLNGRGAFQTPVHPRLTILIPTVGTAPDQPIQAVVRGRGGEQNLYTSAEADCSLLHAHAKPTQIYRHCTNEPSWKWRKRVTSRCNIPRVAEAASPHPALILILDPYKPCSHTGAALHQYHIGSKHASAQAQREHIPKYGNS